MRKVSDTLAWPGSRDRNNSTAAARLVFSASCSDHVTALLRRLHWLRAPGRIAYKLAMLVYRCLYGLAPAY